MSKEARHTKPSPDTSKDAFEESAQQLSTPIIPLDSPTFEKIHLAIPKGEYDQVFKARNHLAYGKKAGLGLVEIVDPTTEDFLHHVSRVGHLYGWNKRKEYQKENRPFLDEMMSQNTTRLYLFRKRLTDEEQKSENHESRDITIGFCLITAIPPCADPETKPATPQTGKDITEIIDIFKANRHLEEDAKAIEINKIGLYDEYTNMGYGNFFLAKILELRLEREKDNIVYLNTRNTNHEGVLRFYAKNGISSFYTESLPNDLIDHEPEAITKPDTTDRTVVVNGDHKNDDENSPSSNQGVQVIDPSQDIDS